MIEFTKRQQKVSLIFVNYRSVLSLSRALRSLQGDDFIRRYGEIIVVNQDSMEQKSIESLSAQWGFRLIQRDNLGFASGANAGAAEANGEYLAFLNPDIRHYSGSFKEIVDALEENTIGVIGATLRDAFGKEERWSYGKMLTLLRLIMQNVFPRVFCWERKCADWVSGGALFIKRARFQSIGGFSEDFFLYFEDMDLCNRVRHMGFSVERSGLLQFVHAGGKSFESKETQKKHFFRSQELYFRKNRPFWEQTLFFFFRWIKIW